MTRAGSACPIACDLLLIAFGLFACSRPEPSKSNIGRLRSNDADNASVTAAAQRPIAHESDPTVTTKPQDSPPTAALPSPSAGGTSGASAVAALARARRGGKSEFEYVVPAPVELADYRTYVESLLKAADSGSSPPNLPVEGFQIDQVNPNLLLLVEQPNRRRGAAAVLVRTGDAAAVAVEVPHSFFDESTLPIGLAVFDAIRARLLLVNTVHRYRSLDGKAPQKETGDDDITSTAESDVAHADRSFFHSAHDAFVRTFDTGTSLQIHGFRDNNAEGVDAILSAASTSARVEPISEHLRQALGLKVAVYPKDIRKLGGTLNVQAKLSRQRQHPFIHIELSQSLRHKLVRDESLLDRFADSLAAELR